MASLLYSQSLTVEGVWNGGGKEVYTEGNEHYCFKPVDGSSVTFNLDANKINWRSCVYLTLGGVLASRCDNDPSLTINNLNNKMYKVVLAPELTSDSIQYILNIEFSGEFGRCADYYQSGFLGMSIEQVNFMLALAGLFTAIGFYGSITYIILTLGNF